MANLIVLAGVPGSGKSTWARQFLDLKYAIVSSDKIRKELAGTLKAAHSDGVKPWDEFYARIANRLGHEVDVVADATFLTRKHRQRVLEVAWCAGARAHIVLFKNVLQASVRNAKRDDDERVPDKVMSDMMQLYYDSLLEIEQEPWDSVTKVESFA